GYARLCSILRKASELGMPLDRHLGPEAWAALVHPDELAMASRLSEFPAAVESAAATREPHKLVNYVQELAREFQSYFTRLKTDPILPPASARSVAGWESSWDRKKTAARLAWIESIRIVYAAALDILGVSAPERMDRPAAVEGADDVDEAEDADGGVVKT
ncbi:MAG: DALR anticodon-binding domain-containing protein, partial [Polyangiaceae bacterium]